MKRPQTLCFAYRATGLKHRIAKRRVFSASPAVAHRADHRLSPAFGLSQDTSYLCSIPGLRDFLCAAAHAPAEDFLDSSMLEL